MALITNISNSADSLAMSGTTATTTLSSTDEDEPEDQHHHVVPFLVSPNILPESNVVVSLSHPSTFPAPAKNINERDNDSLTDTLSTTTDNESFNANSTHPVPHNYINLSSSSSETSLARPLLSNHSYHQNPTTFYTLSANHHSPAQDDEVTTNGSTTSTAGSLTTSCRSYLALYLTDMLIAAFIITPFVNIHWRGAWDLLDIHLLPDMPMTSGLVSSAAGLILLFIMYLLQNILQRFYEQHRKRLTGQVMTRLYTLVIAFAYINQWRGLWNILDMTSNIWYYLVIETSVSILFLALMRSIYNLNSAPFLIAIDTDSYFLLGSKYAVTANRFWQYTFDFILSEVIEAPLLIVAWRGVYNLSDLYILPGKEQAFYSMAVSFLSGYALFFFLALIQIPIMKCLLPLRRIRRLHSFICNMFHLVAFLSVVQIWRSLWMLCEQFLNIPGHHLLTLWLCYGVAFVVLTFGLAACSLNGPGGSKETLIEEGPILLFKFDYFSTLLKQHARESAARETEVRASSEAGVIVWLITRLLWKRQQRRNSLRIQSQSSSAPPPHGHHPVQSSFIGSSSLN